MKYLTILTLTSILFSCNYKLQNSELEDYISNFENSIDIIDQNCIRIYGKIEEQMNEFWGRSMATERWYKRSLVIKAETESCYNLLDSLLLNYQALQINKKEKSYERQENIKELSKRVNIFKETVLKYIDERDESIIDGISNTLNSKVWPSSLYNESNLLEQIAVLTKIKADIKSIESNVLSYLYMNVDGSFGFRFWKIEPIVIPKSETVQFGEQYIADIILGVMDSTRTFEYQIGNDKFIANEYEYDYKEKVTAREGIIRRPGRFVFPRRYAGDSLIIPFNIEYEVLKNN